MKRLASGVGLALLVSLGLFGCGSDAGTASSGSASAKSTGSSKTTTSASAKASAKASSATTASAAASAAPATSGSADAGGGDKKVAVEDLAKGDASGDKALLNVDLSKVPSDAPALGGGEEPPAPKGDAKLEWLPAPGIEIPNPGWKKSEKGELHVLDSPDDKGGVVFTHFGTPEEGLKKVDELTAQLHLKDVKWAKPTEVLVGPDKLPGYVGGGKAADDKGKPVKIFYALVKTGEPQNVLALGGADDDAEETWKTALDIIDSIRKKK